MFFLYHINKIFSNFKIMMAWVFSFKLQLTHFDDKSLTQESKAIITEKAGGVTAKLADIQHIEIGWHGYHTFEYK